MNASNTYVNFHVLVLSPTGYTTGDGFKVQRVDIVSDARGASGDVYPCRAFPDAFRRKCEGPHSLVLSQAGFVHDTPSGSIGFFLG